MYQEILWSIALGAFYGAQAAFYGYMASEELPISWKALLTKEFWSKFKPSKAFSTVILGIVIGAITRGYSFVRPEDWYVFEQLTGLPQIPVALFINFASAVVILGIDKFAKFIVRRTPLVRIWNGLKERVFKALLTRDRLKEAIDNYNESEKVTPAPPE